MQVGVKLVRASFSCLAALLGHLGVRAGESQGGTQELVLGHCRGFKRNRETEGMGKLHGKAGWAAQAAREIHVDVAMAILCHWQFKHEMQWKSFVENHPQPSS